MENNKIEHLEEEGKKPFLKRVANIEKELARISKEFDVLKQVIRSLGR